MSGAVAKYPFKVIDKASGLCWTANNPKAVNTTFSLKKCSSFPLPDNQRFARLYGPDLNPYSPNNRGMTILDASVPKDYPNMWNENSLCLSFYKNGITTVKCGKSGTDPLTLSSLGSTCFGPDIVDLKRLVAYPCPSAEITCDNNISGPSHIPKC